MQNLESIFTIQEFRYLSKNLTFQYKNTIYQVVTEREEYALRKAKVVIHEKKNGSIEVFYKNKPLKIRAYQAQEKAGETADSKTLNQLIDSLQKQGRERQYKPIYNHPWNRAGKLSVRRTAVF